MKVLVLVFYISIMFLSCNNKSYGQNEVLKFKIPDNLNLISEEEINIDDDLSKEKIITANDKNDEYTYEFWVKNGTAVHQYKYPNYSINRKILINLDDNSLKEIIRFQGYEDGLNSAIYKIKGNEEEVLFYFTAAVIDDNFPNKIFYGYPDDIKKIKCNNKGQLLVSLDNMLEDEHPVPNKQIEKPILFFSGISSQPEFQITNINAPKFHTVSEIQNSVYNSEPKPNSHAYIVPNQWIGTYVGDFLRIPSDSLDPRAYANLKIEITQNNSSFLIDSYLENEKINLTYKNSNENNINFDDSPNNNTFQIEKHDTKFILKCSYLDKLMNDQKNYNLTRLN